MTNRALGHAASTHRLTVVEIDRGVRAPRGEVAVAVVVALLGEAGAKAGVPAWSSAMKGLPAGSRPFFHSLFCATTTIEAFIPGLASGCWFMTSPFMVASVQSVGGAVELTHLSLMRCGEEQAAPVITKSPTSTRGADGRSGQCESYRNRLLKPRVKAKKDSCIQA